MRILTVVALGLSLSACTGTDTSSSEGVACVDPRPQVCTMQYAPACATLIAGGSKEYASSCNACADDAVAGYAAGPCPE